MPTTIWACWPGIRRACWISIPGSADFPARACRRNIVDSMAPGTRRICGLGSPQVLSQVKKAPSCRPCERSKAIYRVSCQCGFEAFAGLDHGIERCEPFSDDGDECKLRSISGGRGGIRTHGGFHPTTVFKTVALNHSATLPARRPWPQAGAKLKGKWQSRSCGRRQLGFCGRRIERSCWSTPAVAGRSVAIRSHYFCLLAMIWRRCGHMPCRNLLALF